MSEKLELVAMLEAVASVEGRTEAAAETLELLKRRIGLSPHR